MKRNVSISEKHSLRFVVCFAALLAALLLSACGAQQAQAPEPTPSPTPVPTYDVRFYLKDKLLLEDPLTEGAKAEPVVIDRAGLNFLVWLDAVGNPVGPEESPVT